MFMIRSVFRTIELSQGYVGFLATHEAYVAGLDTLPLFLGIVVYCYFWPPAILTPETRVPRDDVYEPAAISPGGHEYNEMSSRATSDGSDWKQMEAGKM